MLPTRADLRYHLPQYGQRSVAWDEYNHLTQTTDCPHLLSIRNSSMHLFKNKNCICISNIAIRIAWVNFLGARWGTHKYMTLCWISKKGNDMDIFLKWDSSWILMIPEYHWWLGLIDQLQSVLLSSFFLHLKNFHLMTQTASMWLLPVITMEIITVHKADMKNINT